MRKSVFVMLLALFFINVFAEKIYLIDANNLIDSTISVENATGLETSIDSLDLKSIQLYRPEGQFTTREINSFERRKDINLEKQSLLKIKNNHFDLNTTLDTYDSQPLINLSLQREETYEYDAYMERVRLNKKKKMDRIKVIGLYSAAIILNGIGDGLNNTHQKTMGHVFNAASIGVLLSTPFFIEYDKSKWYWYLLTYTSLRVTLFDASYNVTTKQPIDFIGSTAITDKIYKMVDLYGASKAMGLVVGLTIPFRIL